MLSMQNRIRIVSSPACHGNAQFLKGRPRGVMSKGKIDTARLRKAPDPPSAAQGRQCFTDRIIENFHLVTRTRRSTCDRYRPSRSEEHASELQSLTRISYAAFGMKKI